VSTLTHRRFGDREHATGGAPFSESVIPAARSRWQSVADLRKHFADHPGATVIPNGIRFTRIIDRSEFGTIVEEYTL
jgi:hypothetical protein